MAVWLVRLLDGAEPSPALSTVCFFDDVNPRLWYSAHIARLYGLGITAGCGDGSNFCPDQFITRAHMAVFLARTLALPRPPVTNSQFGDVPAGAWYSRHVHALRQTGITKGCGNGQDFCPNQQVTRAQMAVFLQRIRDHRR